MGSDLAGLVRRAEARWEAWWFGPSSLVRLALFRIVVLATALHAVRHYRFAVLDHARRSIPGYVERPWRPIYAFEILGLGPPSEATAEALLAVTFVALACGLVGLATRASCALAAVGTFLVIGTGYSFGKPHHDCIALAFATLTLPFAPVGARLSLDAWLTRALRERRSVRQPAAPESAPWAALPLRATAVTIAIGYFFSGASKLVIGGIDWMNGYTLQAILLHFEAPWSSAFARDVDLCRAMSVGILFVQVTFPIVLFFPRLAWFYVPAAVSFHLITWRTMSTGPYLTLWFLLVAFVPLERIPAFVREHVGRGPFALRAAWMLALAAAAWFLSDVYFAGFPGWARPLTLTVAVAGIAARTLGRRTSLSSATPYR